MSGVFNPKSPIQNPQLASGPGRSARSNFSLGRRGLEQARVKFWLTGLITPVEVVNPLDAIPETALYGGLRPRPPGSSLPGSWLKSALAD